MPSGTGARDASLVAAGIATGAASAALVALYLRDRRLRGKRPRSALSCPPPSELPAFALALASAPDLHRVRLREWEDLAWRSRSGWVGRDFCHNPRSEAVRVLSYYCGGGGTGDGASSSSSSSSSMTGVVYFGPDAESHRGLCHGGSMTALMDDFCGHAAFVAGARPWGGATVQVNVRLTRPVRVGSVLRIHGGVVRREGRKVHVEAVLDDGGDPAVVHAVLEGLSIDGAKMPGEEDAVASRTWEVGVCSQSGRAQRRDSGWSFE